MRGGKVLSRRHLWLGAGLLAVIGSVFWWSVFGGDPPGRHIVIFSGPTLAERRAELVRQGVPEAQIREALGALREQITRRHEEMRAAIERAVGKRLVAGPPGLGERRIIRQSSLTLLTIVVELTRSEAERVRRISGVTQVIEDKPQPWRHVTPTPGVRP